MKDNQWQGHGSPRLTDVCVTRRLTFLVWSYRKTTVSQIAKTKLTLTMIERCQNLLHKSQSLHVDPCALSKASAMATWASEQGHDSVEEVGLVLKNQVFFYFVLYNL